MLQGLAHRIVIDITQCIAALNGICPPLNTFKESDFINLFKAYFNKNTRLTMFRRVSDDLNLHDLTTFVWRSKNETLYSPSCR